MIVQKEKSTSFPNFRNYKFASYFKKFGLMFFWVFLLRLTTVTQIPFTYQIEAVCVIIVFGLLCWKWIKSAFQNYLDSFKFSKLEIYIFALTLLPIMSGVRAYYVFGQPLIFGIMAQRAIWLVLGAMLLLAWIKDSDISLEDAVLSLLYVAWISIFIYSACLIFMDPAHYREVYPLFVIGNDVDGYYFAFKLLPLIFAFIYYFCNGIVNKSKKHYTAAAIIFLYLFLVFEKRSTTLALLLTMLWLSYAILNRYQFFMFLTKSTIVFTIMLALVLIGPHEYFRGVSYRFGQAFKVVFTGQVVADPSSNARIFETLLALPYIKENWFWGNGDLSHQWLGGYEGVMGYFYPSDIGIAGGIFIYGIFGLAIVFFQYYFALRYKNASHVSKEYFVLFYVFKGMILFTFLLAIIQSNLIFSPANSIVFIVLLRAVSAVGVKNKLTAYYKSFPPVLGKPLKS